MRHARHDHEPGVGTSSASWRQLARDEGWSSAPSITSVGHDLRRGGRRAFGSIHGLAVDVHPPPRSPRSSRARARALEGRRPRAGVRAVDRDAQLESIARSTSPPRPASSGCLDLRHARRGRGPGRGAGGTADQRRDPLRRGDRGVDRRPTPKETPQTARALHAERIEDAEEVVVDEEGALGGRRPPKPRRSERSTGRPSRRLIHAVDMGGCRCPRARAAGAVPSPSSSCSTTSSRALDRSAVGWSRCASRRRRYPARMRRRLAMEEVGRPRGGLPLRATCRADRSRSTAARGRAARRGARDAAAGPPPAGAGACGGLRVGAAALRQPRRRLAGTPPERRRRRRQPQLPGRVLEPRAVVHLPAGCLDRRAPQRTNRSSSGTGPASEPETTAVLRLVDELDPALLVDLHSPLACLVPTEAGARRGRRGARPPPSSRVVPDVGRLTPGALRGWCAETGRPGDHLRGRARPAAGPLRPALPGLEALLRGEAA